MSRISQSIEIYQFENWFLNYKSLTQGEAIDKYLFEI